MERDICQTILERIGQDFDGECHLTEAEARETIGLIESLRAQLDEARKLALEEAAQVAENTPKYAAPEKIAAAIRQREERG